ncbi:MAG: biopolymer transporter ExbD [Lentisphaeria bacterium]|nr:biopolymer transporter ExbD [Lentisphaeria bacterium]
MRTKLNVKPVSGPVSAIPLVDVFFLLLVFFMISNSLVFWPGTKVENKVRLPRSRVNSMSIADKLVITITQNGQLYFNDNNVQWDELERELKEWVRDRSIASSHRSNDNDEKLVKRARPPLVLLRADKGIAYEQIINVMSLARSLNLWVYLVTASEQGAENMRRPTLPGDVE